MNDDSKIKKVKVLVMENEVWSRVVGFYSVVHNWNDGKKKGVQ